MNAAAARRRAPAAVRARALARRWVTSSQRVVEPWQSDDSQGLPLSTLSPGGLRMAKYNAWEYVRGAWFASKVMKRAPTLNVNKFGREREPEVVDLFEALSVHRSVQGGASCTACSPDVWAPTAPSVAHSPRPRVSSHVLAHSLQ